MSSQVRILFPPPKKTLPGGLPAEQSIGGSSSVGRAIAFQAIGREFEPRFPLFEWHLAVGHSPESQVLTIELMSWLGQQPTAKSQFCRCSSVVEHFLGKEEVVSSILINGSGMEVGCWKLDIGSWRIRLGGRPGHF